MNMSPDNIAIKIRREHRAEISKKIPKTRLQPQIFEIEYDEYDEEPKLDVFGLAENWGERLTDLPIFNKHHPEDLKKKMDLFPKHVVSFFTGIKEEYREIEMIPVWTIHSSQVATFAVYLLYANNGTIFATPSKHEDSGKRKAEDLDDIMGSNGSMYKKHKIVQSSNRIDKEDKSNSPIDKKDKGDVKWRIGIYNKINEDIKVEIMDDADSSIIGFQHDDHSLHVFDITINNIPPNYAGMLASLTVTIFRRDEYGKDASQATFFLFESYSLEQLEKMIPMQSKQEGTTRNDEYIYVWQFYEMFASFELHQLNVDGK